MQHFAPDHSSEPDYPTRVARDYGRKWKAEMDNGEIWQTCAAEGSSFASHLIARTVHCGCLCTVNTPVLRCPNILVSGNDVFREDLRHSTDCAGLISQFPAARKLLRAPIGTRAACQSTVLNPINA